jgi:hypothetical protein
MGSKPSRPENPTSAEDWKDPDISTQPAQIIKSEASKMTLAFDSQIHQDDLGHDTLMGLQELDSQLAIFEENAARSSLSDISSDDFRDAPEFHSDSQTFEAQINDFSSRAEALAVPRDVETRGISKYVYPRELESSPKHHQFLREPAILVLNVFADPYGVANFKRVASSESKSKKTSPQKLRPLPQILRMFLRY